MHMCRKCGYSGFLKNQRHFAIMICNHLWQWLYTYRYHTHTHTHTQRERERDWTSLNIPKLRCHCPPPTDQSTNIKPPPPPLHTHTHTHTHCCIPNTSLGVADMITFETGKLRPCAPGAARGLHIGNTRQRIGEGGSPDPMTEYG